MALLKRRERTPPRNRHKFEVICECVNVLKLLRANDGYEHGASLASVFHEPPVDDIIRRLVKKHVYSMIICACMSAAMATRKTWHASKVHRKAQPPTQRCFVTRNARQSSLAHTDRLRWCNHKFHGPSNHGLVLHPYHPWGLDQRGTPCRHS